MVIEQLGTKPLQLTQSERVSLGFQLEDSRVVPSTDFPPHGFFNQSGIFGIEYKGAGRTGIGYAEAIWCGNLLRYDPRTHFVRLSPQGWLWVSGRDNPNEPVHTATVGSMRYVEEIGTGKTVVREGGYVFNPALKVQMFLAGEHLSFEEVVDEIKKGEDSRFQGSRAKFHSFVRVNNPNLIGQEIVQVEFTKREPPYHHIDRVLIDPSTRQIVDREIVYPFITRKEYDQMTQNLVSGITIK